MCILPRNSNCDIEKVGAEEPKPESQHWVRVLGLSERCSVMSWALRRCLPDLVVTFVTLSYSFSLLELNDSINENSDTVGQIVHYIMKNEGRNMFMFGGVSLLLQISLESESERLLAAFT